MIEELEARGYNIETIQHARSILITEFPDAVTELREVILPIQIPITELVFGGGGKTEVVKRIERRFKGKGWLKHNFELKRLVDGVATQAMSHEIDHVKRYPQGTLALEIEWNNKDPFFDRDLQNFRQLHADGAISLGIIITRGDSLQDQIKGRIEQFAHLNGIGSVDDLKKYYTPTGSQARSIIKQVNNGKPFAEAWAGNFVSSKFGQSTTHWAKLKDRIDRGVGNPCPLILIGIPIDVVID